MVMHAKSFSLACLCTLCSFSLFFSLFIHSLVPHCSFSRFPSFNLSLQPSSFYPLFFLHLSPSLILSPSFSTSLFLAHSPVLVLYLPHSRSRSELSLASETTGILSPSPEISPLESARNHVFSGNLTNQLKFISALSQMVNDQRYNDA